MEISYPFNVTRVSDGFVIPSTKAFPNQHAGYHLEKEAADRLGVQRAEKGTPEFTTMVTSYPSVKWAYTVHRKLYVVPENFGHHEVPHSIAGANMPVFCAGIAEHKAGTVKVNNWTGHYKVERQRAEADILEAWADSGFVVHVVDLSTNGTGV